MDRIIEKKGLSKSFYAVVGVVFLLLIVWGISFAMHRNEDVLKISQEGVVISTVVDGSFKDYIRVQAKAKPKYVIYLSALEAGVIDEIYVEEGEFVEQGDVVARLKNPSLNLDILNSEAQLAEKQNFLRNTQVTMEQEKLQLRQELLNLDRDLKKKLRAYDQYKTLYAEDLISKEDYLVAEEDYHYLCDKRKLLLDRIEQDSLFRTIQIAQLSGSLDNMSENMKLVKQRSENLSIVASRSGQIGRLDVELGQSVHTGMSIAQINVLTDYIVEASIGEHHLGRVNNNLQASFEEGSRQFSLAIKKIYPEVESRYFKADLEFVDDKPAQIVVGQSYFLDLELAKPENRTLLPRGSFYESTSGKWVYVLSEDGKKATRHSVQLGRQNPLYYEVVSGLKPGDRVITSGYDQYNENRILIIK